MSICLVFTNFEREKYWKNLIPNEFIYNSLIHFQVILERIIKRQKKLKELGKLVPLNLIIDSKVYVSDEIPKIPEGLMIIVNHQSTIYNFLN